MTTAARPSPKDVDPLALPDVLRPAIEARRTEIESQRRLPSELVATLRASGAFRIFTPREYGGFESSLTDMVTVLEAIGRIDASVVWTMWNGNLGFFAVWLRDAGVATIWDAHPDPIIVNSTRLTGSATPAENGYTLSGRWDIVTGVDAADWIALFALVPPPGGSDDSEHPEVRVFCVPRDAVTVLDTWHVGGMRGTGSNSVVVDQLFVPAEMTNDVFAPFRIDRPLYRIPAFTLASTGGAGAVLGIARAAVDEIVELAGTKVTEIGTPLGHGEHVQDAIGRAEAALRSARLLLFAATGTIDDAAAAGAPITEAMRAELRAAMSNAGEISRIVLTSMYELGGSSSLYTGNRVEQLFRDGLAGTQHGILGRAQFALAGRVRLGLDPQSPIF
ncbi:acyl-CoA dehydrogenase family protein [Pseudonocardia alaniniphila]|uniref:Acyl-CoA dehydrogenase family protein n=1 Tax=Pseudonocardia alaniniphila TaxID=75291 RepID=A0ABS9T7A2_9PSEU|nr:acyl-CoA dehydrogenase family protein [Pseudonocardia alaniniphila]MCH6164405.1 acyl-CoA dehydrogenase family protein [Pseudonocardia alaniniphila]